MKLVTPHPLWTMQQFVAGAISYMLSSRIPGRDGRYLISECPNHLPSLHPHTVVVFFHQHYHPVPDIDIKYLK
jgi:hypothetical protein